MPDDNQIDDIPVGGYGEVNICTLAHDVEQALAELDTVVTSLPRVDHDGTSECPFADKLYAKKELAAHKVAELLVKARKAMAATGAEIYRLLRNIDIIERDAPTIDTTETQGKYHDAAASQREQLSVARRFEEILRKAIPEMERALAYAEKLAYPGMPVQRVPPKAEPHPDPEKADQEEWDRISRGYSSVAAPSATAADVPGTRSLNSQK